MNRASAPSYDLFKLIVTIALVILLILMLMRGCATTTAAPLPTETGAVSPPAPSSPVSTQTETVQAADTGESATSSPAPSATLTVAATIPPTSGTITPTPEPITIAPGATTAEPTTTAATPSTGSGDSTSCNTSVPSRLSVGQTARVVQRLNMRNAASITAPILQTNPVNTQVEIIGGPVCTPVGDQAYLWWQIRLANGAEGWSAEAPLNDATYLLEPVP